MGILKRFFSSPESLAKELVVDDTKLLAAWKEYVASTKEKGELITGLFPGPDARKTVYVLPRLKNVVISELVTITAEQKTRQELLADLSAIEHEKHIKRVQKLEHTLGHAATKYEYVYQLLKELTHILTNQIHIIELLNKDSTQDAVLVQKLKEYWKVEQHILAQIGEMQTFHQLFSDLLKGQHLIRQLTKTETKFVSRAEKETGITNRLLSRWFREINLRLGDKINEEVANHTLDPSFDQHFEFVNSPAFIDFARPVIQSLRTKPVSESAFNTFIHLFREWFNNEYR